MGHIETWEESDEKTLLEQKGVEMTKTSTPQGTEQGNEREKQNLRLLHIAERSERKKKSDVQRVQWDAERKSQESREIQVWKMYHKFVWETRKKENKKDPQKINDWEGLIKTMGWGWQAGWNEELYGSSRKTTEKRQAEKTNCGGKKWGGYTVCCVKPHTFSSNCYHPISFLFSLSVLADSRATWK